MSFSPLLHLAFESGGLTVGGLLYWRQSNAATQPADRWTRWGLLAGAAVGAAIGSRGLYMLQYWSALGGQPLTAWLGGKTIVGGLLGAILGVETAKRLLHWPASTGDGFVVPLAVALMIGRIGCQLSGVSDLTYGNVTELPWGWDYGDGIPRHPFGPSAVGVITPERWGSLSAIQWACVAGLAYYARDILRWLKQGNRSA
jgi:phosphatidylglycerol---prolipoprotein diacylglyceryl transferase